MESLQMAQIMADLSSLQNSDPIAASNLLAANHTLNSNADRRKSRAGNPAEPPRFDKLGRRIVVPTRTTPTMSRVNSTTSDISSHSVESMRMGGSGCSSGRGTPTSAGKTLDETDEDMKRAKTLLHLFEMRPQFKEMGENGLARSKDKVDAVVAKYAQKELDLKERAAREKYLSPKA